MLQGLITNAEQYNLAKVRQILLFLAFSPLPACFENAFA